MNNTLKKQWSNFFTSDIELFKLINKVTTVNDCNYFLIGAKARDILLEYFGKNEAQRATLDTDIAICCKNWSEFYKIKHYFINTEDFLIDKKYEHRVISSKFGNLDILPFGEIKEENQNLKWPPLSGCRLLGRDFKRLSFETQNRLRKFFENKTAMDDLAISISSNQMDYDLAISMLEMIKQGFIETLAIIET